MKIRFLAILLLAVLAGCDCDDDSTTFPVGQSNNPAPTTGTAANDAYNVTSNIALVVNATNGLLANDTAGGTVVASDNPSAQNGVVVTSGDGSFTYTPANGFVGIDTFTYTVQYSGNQSTATVTLTVVPNAIFVDNTAPNGGTGTFNSRFNTLAGALAASSAGDTIFIFRGDGTNMGLAGPVNLLDNQRLVGEGAGLGVLAQGFGAPGGFPVLTGPVTMANGNTVQGLRFEGATDAIIANAVDSGTVVGNQFVNPTSNGLDIGPAFGTWTITNNAFQGDVGGAIVVDGTLAAGNVNYIINDNTFDGSVAAAVLGSGGAVTARAQLNNNTATNIVGPNTFLFVTSDDGMFCLDMTGNTTNRNILFDQSGASVLNVEQFSQFGVLNTSGGVVVQTGMVTDVADGFCGF